MNSFERNLDAWRRATRQAMQAEGLTHTQVAERVGIAWETFRNYLSEAKSKSRPPPLERIPQIADAVGMDHLEAVRLLGLVPDDFLSHVELRQANEALLERLNELLRYAQPGAGTLVDAVLESGQFGIAVWPVLEGPSDNQLEHVADRVQIIPISQRAGAAERVEQSTDLVAADYVIKDRTVAKCLRLIGADRWRWDDREEYPITAELQGSDSDEKVARYSLQRLSRDRTPGDHPATINAPVQSLLVVSLIQAAWPSTTAALLARELEWGLIGTRSIAHQRSEMPASSSQQKTSAWETNRRRNEALGQLLRRPPESYVAYHFGTPVLSTDPKATDVVAPNALVASRSQRSTALPFVILLCETDPLIEFHVRKRSKRFGEQTLRSFRDELRQSVEALKRQRRALIIDVELPADIDETSETEVRRQAFWDRTYRTVELSYAELRS